MNSKRLIPLVLFMSIAAGCAPGFKALEKQNLASVAPIDEAAPNGESSSSRGTEIISLDGSKLYELHCANCHGVLSVSDQSGSSALKITNSIKAVSQMNRLEILTEAEINAIASTLGGAVSMPTPTPTPTPTPMPPSAATPIPTATPSTNTTPTPTPRPTATPIPTPTPPPTTSSSNGYVTIANSEEVFSSLVSIAGVEALTNPNKLEYKTPAVSFTLTRKFSALYNFRNSFRVPMSQDGDPASVNAPLMMTLVSISGDVCFTWVDDETRKAASSRRVFNQIDFNAGPDRVSDAAKNDVIRRLSRLAWGRNETDQERTLIKGALLEFTGTSPADTQRAMIFTCSAMLASLDTHVR